MGNYKIPKGKTGVYDKTLNKFFPCVSGGHFDQIVKITKEYYPEKYKQIHFYVYGTSEEEKRDLLPEIDKFILENFQLRGDDHEERI